MDNIELLSIVRKLAKSNYYQTIFSLSKECPIWVLENKENFTSLQILFLNYLSFYNSVQTDVATGEVSEKVLDNEIYEDAYAYWRNKDRKKMNEKSRTMQQVRIPEKGKETSTRSERWIFKRPPKKK